MKMIKALGAAASCALLLAAYQPLPASAAVQDIAAIDFADVACSSATQCLGVGFGSAAPLDLATGAVSDGGSVQTISGAGALSSVACPSAGRCLAVGMDAGGTSAVAVVINPATGALASGQSVQSITGVADLTGVSCPSPALCLAVGGDSAVLLDPATGAVARGQSVQTIAGIANFAGVACASTDGCLAVGENAARTAGAAVSLSPATGDVSGGQWVQDDTRHQVLTGVACPSANQCLAVGWAPGKPSAAVPLNPTTGSVAAGQSVQDIAGASALVRVACPTATQCVGVGGENGRDSAGGQAVPLDPGTGSVAAGQSVQDISGTGFLNGVACTPAAQCVGVGSGFEGDLGGASVPLDPATGAALSDAFTPLSPVRICDTRPGNPSTLNTAPADQCNGPSDSGGTIAPGGTLAFHVGGSFGVPDDATAAMLNITVVDPGAAGYLTAYPSGSTRPGTSSVDYGAGEIVPNLVEVGIGSSGDVALFSSARADVVVDLEGYASPLAAGGPGAGLYNPLPTSARICDTRPGNPSHLNTAPDDQCDGPGNRGKTLSAGGTITISVGGANGIPAHPSAIVLNLTVADARARGFAAVYPAGTARPLGSNDNYAAGQATSNRVVVPLPADGRITVYSSQQADVIVDVSGYISAAGGTGSRFTSIGDPIRICDTRTGDPSSLSGPFYQCVGHTIHAGAELPVQVSGLVGVPADATAVEVNLTAVGPSAATFLTVTGSSLPSPTSDLNVSAGETRANMVIVPLSPSGTINIYNSAGRTDVVLDVLGWYR